MWSLYISKMDKGGKSRLASRKWWQLQTLLLTMRKRQPKFIFMASEKLSSFNFGGRIRTTNSWNVIMMMISIWEVLFLGWSSNQLHFVNYVLCLSLYDKNPQQNWNLVYIIARMQLSIRFVPSIECSNLIKLFSGLHTFFFS